MQIAKGLYRIGSDIVNSYLDWPSITARLIPSESVMAARSATASTTENGPDGGRDAPWPRMSHVRT